MHHNILKSKTTLATFPAGSTNDMSLNKAKRYNGPPIAAVRPFAVQRIVTC